MWKNWMLQIYRLLSKYQEMPRDSTNKYTIRGEMNQPIDLWYVQL